MYLASATRPDISFAVSKLSRFTSNLRDIIGVRLSELCTTWLVQWIMKFIIPCIL
jgi:hypothetical protein